MERYIKICLRILLIFLVSLITTCSTEVSTDTDDGNIKFSSHQIPGCNKTVLLGKSELMDSCFSYSFYDTLKINFCVIGNCCPDSNRFVTSFKIKSDTIFINVVDTAANLCRCICNYVIHSEISGLAKGRYLFYCSYENLTYNEIIKKLN